MATRTSRRARPTQPCASWSSARSNRRSRTRQLAPRRVRRVPAGRGRGGASRNPSDARDGTPAPEPSAGLRTAARKRGTRSAATAAHVARRRRHGRSLRGPRCRARSRDRAQGVTPRARGERDRVDRAACCASRADGEGRQPGGDHGPRRRPRRRHRVHRDGADSRRDARRARRAARAARGASHRAVRARGARPGRGARGRHRPPRLQAGQRARRARTTTAVARRRHRLRHRAPARSVGHGSRDGPAAVGLGVPTTSS